MRTIFCFGDSLTFGEKDMEAGGWVERLRHHFLVKEESLTYQQTLVYNLGIASETTDGVVSRIESEVKARRVGKSPSIALLGYGMNDIKIHKNKNLVPVEYFKRNLLSAINTLAILGVKVFLQNIPPINFELDGVPDQNNNLRFESDVLAYNRLIETIVKQNAAKVTHLDTFSVLTNAKQSIYADDKLHLNAIGHELIFKTVLTLIENQSNLK